MLPPSSPGVGSRDNALAVPEEYGKNFLSRAVAELFVAKGARPGIVRAGIIWPMTAPEEPGVARTDTGGVPDGSSAPPFGRWTIVALLVWGIAILLVTAGIAGETALWPVVPVLGVAAPIALAFLHERGQGETLRGRQARAVLASDERAEREVLDVLEEAGGLTPMGAAARTSLTVTQAAEVLERLAGRGHLDVNAREGALVYALREGDRRALVGTENLATAGEHEQPPRPGAQIQRLDEPLSERELEVLRLLATGRTNREIAQDLFVAVGTVKAHVSNVYRKLDAHNRAEALSRARSFGLLG